MCHNSQWNMKHIFSTASNETLIKKNTVLNVTQPIETVEEKIEVCGYNTECFISLGWMIDATVVELFMNAAQNEI